MKDLNSNQKISQDVIDEIVLSLKKIKYGEVVITVHDSKVVQIEKREKKRFP
ncbi:MAG: YezD family protein [Candidatus Omnitrophota bacterium]